MKFQIFESGSEQNNSLQKGGRERERVLAQNKNKAKLEQLKLNKTCPSTWS
jgi:hypothetical protein